MMNSANENVSKNDGRYESEAVGRNKIITRTSTVGIVANLFIACIKVVLGVLTSSIAIASEGVNNATDAMTSVLTLVGTKLAGKRPDKKHPFGYGRIEYLTSLVISVIILVSGAEMLISSVKLIFTPADLSVTYVSLIIVAVSAAIKMFLGLYTVKMGKKVGSGALVALGTESRNDSFASVVTLVSAAVFIIFDFSIDAYAGIITSLLILKAGIDVLADTVSELLGRPGEKELADKIYEQIRSTDGILNAADMMLHNYGPDSFSGSVNIEIDHRKTVGEIYQFIHALQLRIMREYNVVMVFGIYAVDNDSEKSKKVRESVERFIENYGHIKSYHAIYFDIFSDKLYCDLVVDYELKEWDKLKEEFTSYMKILYPENTLELTVETEFV